MCKESENNCFSDLKTITDYQKPIQTDYTNGIVQPPSTATGNVKDSFGLLQSVNVYVKGISRSEESREGKGCKSGWGASL